MKTTRRSFFASLAALFVAPKVVKAPMPDMDSLARIAAMKAAHPLIVVRTGLPPVAWKSIYPEGSSVGLLEANQILADLPWNES